MKKINLSIKIKLIIPITIVLITVSIILVVFLRNKTQEIIQERAQTDSKFIKEYIYNSIERVSGKALTIASLFSSIENIEKAYEISNEDSARNYLRKLITPYKEGLKKEGVNNDEIKIHYHKPLAKSLLRSWRPKNNGDGGDNLSGFRNSILKVSHNEIPVKGIEIGKGGLVIRGIVPIFSNQKYIGSVENFYSLEHLTQQILLNENQNLSVFFNKKASEIAWSLQKNPTVGNFRFVSQSKELAMNSYDLKLLEKGNENEFMMIKGNKAITVFPIYDFDGKKAGVFYYTLDLTELINNERNTSYFLISRLLIAFAIIFLLIILFIHFAVSKPLQILEKTFKKIAKGKLEHNFNNKQNDEIGSISRAAKHMIIKIKDILTTVKNTSVQLSMAANEISSAAQQVSSGANEQASTSEEITASIDEIMQEINRSADNALITSNISKKSSEGLVRTESNILKIINSIQTINEKIKYIDEIADKTDILSLNAAVESARAGVAGKGFSVVSSEIKKLAQQTQELANHIVELSSNSVNMANKAGAEISNNLPEIKKTFNLIDEITASSQSQRTSIQNLNTAIYEMNKVTQSNAASSEELASNSEELTAQAEMLEASIKFFKFKNKEISLHKNKQTHEEIKKETEIENEFADFDLDNEDKNEEFQEF